MAQFSHAEEKIIITINRLVKRYNCPSPKWVSERTIAQTNKSQWTSKSKKTFRILFFAHSSWCVQVCVWFHCHNTQASSIHILYWLKWYFLAHYTPYSIWLENEPELVFIVIYWIYYYLLVISKYSPLCRREICGGKKSSVLIWSAGVWY